MPQVKEANQGFTLLQKPDNPLKWRLIPINEEYVVAEALVMNKSES